MRGPEGNDIHKTNVPCIRIAFRHKVYEYMALGTKSFFVPFLLLLILRFCRHGWRR